MDELLDMMVSDESPSQISDQIKDMLYDKASKRVDAFRPLVTNSIFSGEDQIETEEQSDEESESSDGV